MAEPQAQESQDTVPIGSTQPAAPPARGLDLSSLTGSPPAPELSAGLADIKRREVETKSKVSDEMLAGMERDRARLEQAYKAEALEPGALKPWNAEQESAKHRTDPIQAFGSIGSVFGILASAFTRTPMENALNASAAAMQSIKAGDALEYERSYKAWEANTRLALQRQQIQHQQFTDAATLMQTNMALGHAKLQVMATKFGDQKFLFLLENGMDKELFELQQSRQELSLKLAAAMPGIVTENAKMGDLLNSGFRPGDNTPENAKKLRDWQERWNPAREEGRLRLEETARHNTAMETLQQQGRDDQTARTEELSRHNREMEAIQKRRTETQQKPENKFIEEYFEKHPDQQVDSPEFTEALKKFREADSKKGPAGGNTSLTGDRQRAADVQAYREELKNTKNDDGTPKYSMQQIADMAAKRESQLKTTASAPSGNKIDTMKSLYDRAGFMTDTIGKMEELLVKHKALTGLGGTVTRPAEVVSNWFGSNETDRAQFKRYVSELHEWGTRVLNESAGRPLSAEMSKLASILPGLEKGDTTANVVRAYREIKPLLGAIREQLNKRISGEWTPSGPGSAKPADNKPRWMEAPEAQ